MIIRKYDAIIRCESKLHYHKNKEKKKWNGGMENYEWTEKIKR